MSRPSTSATLKKLSEQEFDLKQLPEIFDEINSGTDRSVAIVWSALVEDALRIAIMRKMSHLTPSELNNLFVGYGPLANFSGKIMVAYAMGLITKQDTADLRRIREIRNAFAHGFVKLSFEQKAVSDVCQLLHIGRTWPGVEHDDPKHLFHLTCMALWSRLGKRVEGIMYGPRGVETITSR